MTRKNDGLESDLPLTISAQYGLVDQREFFSKQVASRDLSGYYLLMRGEFAYNKSTSVASPWGVVKRLVNYEKGCVSTLYIAFNARNINPDFLATYYETDRWHKGIQAIATEGARNHGLLNVAPDDFFATGLIIPTDHEEQQAIAGFFEQFDALITLHQRKCDNAFQDGDRSADLLCCLQIVKNARRNRSKTYCFCCGNVRRNRRWCLFLCQRKPAFLLEGDAI